MLSPRMTFRDSTQPVGKTLFSSAACGAAVSGLAIVVNSGRAKDAISRALHREVLKVVAPLRAHVRVNVLEVRKLNRGSHHDTGRLPSPAGRRRFLILGSYDDQLSGVKFG